MTSGAVPVVAVVGPTASGKSALGQALAESLGGQIVNADAMQLYEGMDIGTAKATPAERRATPHHLLDIWTPEQQASVADYQRQARGCVGRLVEAGIPAVIVGGSGLYVRALLDDLDFPGTDPAIRAVLSGELETAGAGALHARLAGLDPLAAAAILPSNGRRVVRALEVIQLTGRPFSASLPTYGALAFGAVLVGLDQPVVALDEAIEARVEGMWRAGLVAEVARLRERLGPTSSRALGYAQVLAWFRGELATEAAAKEATARATRRFARRQRAWFRRDPRIRWLQAGAGFPALAAEALAAVALAAVAAGPGAIHPDATTDLPR